METYFTGTWESNLPGQIYHGAFQLVLDVKGIKMSGSWIGFDANNEVQHSVYQWQLVSRDISAEAREKKLSEFESRDSA